MGRHSKRWIPKLAFTKTQDIGWHVNYRDLVNGIPRRKRFGLIEREDALGLYATWLSDHLRGVPHQSSEKKSEATKNKETAEASAKTPPGSLLYVASNFLFYEEKRAKRHGEPRRPGTISPNGFLDRKFDVADFLEFINKRYGQGAAGKLSVIDLKLLDGTFYPFLVLANNLFQFCLAEPVAHERKTTPAEIAGSCLLSPTAITTAPAFLASLRSRFS